MHLGTGAVVHALTYALGSIPTLEHRLHKGIILLRPRFGEWIVEPTGATLILAPQPAPCTVWHQTLPKNPRPKIIK